jgi:hypothetical protein
MVCTLAYIFYAFGLSQRGAFAGRQLLKQEQEQVDNIRLLLAPKDLDERRRQVSVEGNFSLGYIARRGIYNDIIGADPVKRPRIPWSHGAH